jgi:Secretion system C-terminal sorting domain/Fibronectin type III domain
MKSPFSTFHQSTKTLYLLLFLLLLNNTFAQSCYPPSSIQLIDSSFSSVNVTWNKPTSATKFIIRYDEIGFVTKNSNTQYTTDNKISINNLAENKEYEVQVASICTAGDTTGFNSYIFRTKYKYDVGISTSYFPSSTCDLGAPKDSVKIYIKNYGSLPVTGIFFNYSVNGNTILQPSNFPRDGYYTGVIAKDSARAISFETSANTFFGTPGKDYIVKIWTKYSDDKNTANDTFTYVVTHKKTEQGIPITGSFETGTDNWNDDLNSQKSTWIRSQPNGKNVFWPANGNTAWTTGRNYGNNQLSYLTSPCMNFTNLTNDPRINFALEYDTELNKDSFWLESSIDGGKIWNRVATNTTSVNWQDKWSGNSNNNWIRVQSVLTGLNKKPDVKLRFVFKSDTNNDVFGGVSIDNIAINQVSANDIGANYAVKKVKNDCGQINDTLQLSVSNFGTSSISGKLVTFSYLTDVGTVVNEPADTNLVILTKGTYLYTFKKSFNSTGGGNHKLKAWVTYNSDLSILNDTINYEFNNTEFESIPQTFTFEDKAISTNWNTDNASANPNFTGNGNVMSINVTDNKLLSFVNTGIYGAVSPSDSFFFTYRFKNPVGSTNYTLKTGEYALAQIRSSCGAWITLDSINAINQNTSTNLAIRKFPLNLYAGKYVQFRFLVNKVTNGITFDWDIDNVFIGQCNNNLGISLKTISNKSATDSVGRVSVIPTKGIAPFTFKWSQTPFRTDSLKNGSYSVTVTDARGCSEVRSFYIGTVANNDKATEEYNFVQSVVLAPNPTNGNVTINVEYTQASEVTVQIMNLMGQVLMQDKNRFAGFYDQFQFDVSDLPEGMYLVRLLSNNRQHISKLIKVN